MANAIEKLEYKMLRELQSLHHLLQPQIADIFNRLVAAEQEITALKTFKHKITTHEEIG